MLEELKEAVWRANLQLVKEGLVARTWGNVSGADRRRGLMVIKPSGVPYESMRPEHMAVVSLEDGRPAEKGLRPSSDAPTHLELYRAWPAVGGVAHTHSLHATAWAQARRSIPPLGTTHADHFHGPIPCCRPLREEEIRSHYEAATGKVIVEAFAGADPMACPAALAAGHGPFTWGETPDAAVANAAALEYAAQLALHTLALAPDAPPLGRSLLDKHFFRKHGPSAYYGQNTDHP
ncbi:MAG: L-ribulose-5-phosphate 4-epimerase AraD [Verrucomicrobia bacterium]|nr:L-ribulose-5-phosphate 4-epimerase AraD [Verrucomicrobiota bacterium]